MADQDKGTVGELSFTASLPRAPVQSTVIEGERVVLDLEQIARQRTTLPGRR